MDKIKQYYKLTNIKPEYYALTIPYYTASKKRITFNAKELILYYLEEFGIYTDIIEKRGGSEKIEIFLLD